MAQQYSVLKAQENWGSYYFYRKSVVLYQMTVVFCRRFLPKHGDRTVDQMVQAARSGKQNIVEGLADGVTSTEMELKLLNVARASFKELLEDYQDYLTSHHLSLWNANHPRYDGLLKYCRCNNDFPQYAPFFEVWFDEELANCAVTLLHQVDKAMMTRLKEKEADFVENGGIRERMTANRLGRRQTQNETIVAQQNEIDKLRDENRKLREIIEGLKTK